MERAHVIKKALLALVVTWVFAAIAWSQNSAEPDDVLRAAQAGDSEAQLEMGILYEYGFFMEGSEVPALAWYMLAAERGNQKAAKRRDLLMGRMPHTDIERARQQTAGLVSGPPTVQ